MGFLDGLVKGVSGFFGGGAPPPYQTPQNIQNFMQPITANEMQKVGLYDNLVNAKLGYDKANKNIEGWGQKLADPALTDEQRQEINQNIQGWQREREAHAQTANQLRDAATALGLDIADYGSDKTSQQSAQALANYKNLAVQNFLNNMPTLDELEQNRYRELRSQGASPGQANRIVGRERAGMNSLLARRLGDFMTTYGTNPDGSINQDLGIAAMTRVLPDPQSVAQLFANGFAMPNKVYDANRQYAQAMDVAKFNRDSAIALANVNNAAAMGRTKYTTDANVRMSREGITAKHEDLAATLSAGEKRQQRQHEHEMRLKLVDFVSKGVSGTNSNKLSPFQQSYEDLLNAYGYYAPNATDEQKAEAQQKAWHGAMRKHFPDEFNLDSETFVKKLETGIAMGLTPQEALEYAKAGVGWKPPEGSKAAGAFNTLDAVGDFIAQGKDDEAGALLQTFDEQAEADLNKFNGMFNPKTNEYANFLAMKNAYIEYLSIGKDKTKYADANALAKAQAEGKDVLNAKIMAVRRGTKWQDELESIRNARATYRRTHGEEKSTTATDNANANVDALLGKNRLNPAQSAANVPNPVGGAGYAGTNQTSTTSWVSPYGNYQTR